MRELVPVVDAIPEPTGIEKLEKAIDDMGLRAVLPSDVDIADLWANTEGAGTDEDRVGSVIGMLLSA